MARGAVANLSHRALRVGQRHVRPCRPALAGQAIEEHEGGDPLARQQAGHLIALLVDHHPAIAATRHDQHGRAIGPGRAEDGQPRPAHGEHDAVVIGGVGAALAHCLGERRRRHAGRVARPQIDPFVGLDQGRRRRLHGGGAGRKAAGQRAKHERAPIEPHRATAAARAASQSSRLVMPSPSRSSLPSARAGSRPCALSQTSGMPSPSRSGSTLPAVRSGQPPTSFWLSIWLPVRLRTLSTMRASALSRGQAPARART